MKNIMLVLTFLLVTNSYSQIADRPDFVAPRPVVGWDSLSHLLSYPELLRRAGVQGGYSMKLKIDTLGDVEWIRIFELYQPEKQEDTNDPLNHYLYYSLKHTKWIPASVGKKKVDFEFTIPVLFIIRPKDQSNPIIISAPAYKQSAAVY
jgi:hypothetical protein